MNLSVLLVPDPGQTTNTECLSFLTSERSLMQSRRNTLLCHYRYDALDRLIANEQPSAPERQRFYCKSRLATEIQGVNRYSLLQHGDQILAQQQSEGDALSTTLLATDQQRSVLQTLNANQTRRPIAYTPYGHHRPENGLLSLLGFNGERPDPVTGCYLLGNGYRAFNPVLMRFNCPDSWSPFGDGGLNSYMYCLGDPINNTDSTGHVREFFARLLGRQPSAPTPISSFGSRFVSRPGITPEEATRAHARIIEIETKIPELISDAQLSVFTRDQFDLSISTSSKPPQASMRLEQLAYRAARPETREFMDPRYIAHPFEKPYNKLINNAAATDQAGYRILFQRLNQITGPDISTRLALISRKGLDRGLISSYKKRMNSAIPGEVDVLQAERYRIRDQHFQ